jgi:hypothetical protein
MRVDGWPAGTARHGTQAAVAARRDNGDGTAVECAATQYAAYDAVIPRTCARHQLECTRTRPSRRHQLRQVERDPESGIQFRDLSAGD